MIEVEMSKDIRDYSAKVLGPFTGKQLACLGLAAAYGVPLIILLPFGLIPNIIIGMVCMLPVIACGWIKPYGIPLEKFLFKCMFPIILGKGRRKVRNKNDFDYLEKKKPEINKVIRNRKIKAYK